MNAEIYFPRNGKAFGQTSEKSFENTIKKLGDINVNIIYKTEVNLTEQSISEALSVSNSGDEKIGIIFIADALSEDSTEKAKEILESVGIIGKIKRYEAECKNPEETEQTAENPSEKKKKKKKRNKKSDNEESLIDISQGIVSIEKPNVYFYTVEYNNKLIVVLPKHDVLDTDFSKTLYTAAKKLVSPKKKRSFRKRFIPCKGDRPIDVVRKVILILAVCTFLVSSLMLLNMLVLEPMDQDRKTNEIRGLYVSTDEGEESNGKKTVKPIDGSDGVLADFEELLKVNPDTIGWINIPNTVIDYVVVQSPYEDDPEYYLHRDFYGNYSKYGTIFLDYRSKLDSKNLILHGHHMQDGRMFANINYYGADGNLEFYKKTPVFTFNTIYEKSKWKIISVFKTNTLEYQGEFFNYLRGSFTSDYDFLNFIYELRVRSLIDCPVSVNENDTLVTLSTCNYDMEEFRFVVVARKVRDGEDATVDVSKAVENPNPLYPDAWYYTYGGTKPEVTSFQDAYNNKKIDWYDGKGKWSEKDDQELVRLLEEGKTNAEKMLKEYIKGKEYGPSEQAQINEIIDKYMKLINNSTKAANVNDLYAQAVTELDKVRTKQQVASDEEASKKNAEREKKEASEASAKALSEAIDDGIEKMTNSVSGNEYRVAQHSQVTEIIDSYTARIRAAKTIEEVEKLTSTAIEELKKVKTNSQMREEEEKEEEAKKKAEQEAAKKKAEEEAKKKAEEEAKKKAEQEAFESYKSSKISELESYLDISDYSADQQESMNAIISEFTASINDASSYSEVDDYLRLAKSQLDTAASQNSSSEETSQDDETSEDDNNE